ncbi:unnamed protein product [Ceratitis capitata]|uniref:(Mediterranean fruit fly) hypothetical protein n=1 Tax=Ceratitis capitata TaxID=7213 RepID=A0A811UVL6_CERCA|nr:unnamed protein product [Ceratitis capitata]
MELMKWSSITLEFLDPMPRHDPDLIATKRSELSTIARLFDPLGYLTPNTVAAKSVLKEIWTKKVEHQSGQMSSRVG